MPTNPCMVMANGRIMNCCYCVIVSKIMDLRLNAIENFPREFYRDIMLGKPNRDRQIEKVQRTLENIARAGIPVFGYDWDPTDVLRSSVTHKLRGGAESMSINLADYANAPLLLDRVYSENEMWEYYHYFLEHIIPVIESVGLKMALHPTDPPVPSLGGVPRLFRSRDAFDKAFSLVPSNNHGCEFCLGNWAAMGEDIIDVIDHYGKQNKIFYVHFSNHFKRITRTWKTARSICRYARLLRPDRSFTKIQGSGFYRSYYSRACSAHHR